MSHAGRGRRARSAMAFIWRNASSSASLKWAAISLRHQSPSIGECSSSSSPRADSSLTTVFAHSRRALSTQPVLTLCRRSMGLFQRGLQPLTLCRRPKYHYYAVISAQALPFTLLIVLVEFTVGGLWVLWAAHVRGQSAASFVKFGAGMVAVMAVLTFWLAAKLTVDKEVDGYPLDLSYMLEARVALALV